MCKLGCLLKEENLFLKSSVLYKNSFHFNSVSGFFIFVPKKLCSLKKSSSLGQNHSQLLLYKKKSFVLNFNFLQIYSLFHF